MPVSAKVGDILRRHFRGSASIHMDVRVKHVDREHLYCQPLEATWDRDDWWRFRRDNGVEVDEDGVPMEGEFASYVVPILRA